MRTRDAFNVDPAGHSNYNPMRQFWDATLTQDVWPAVWGWRLLNARCFACSFGMAPSCLPFEYCNITFSCHSNMALWSAMILGPGITVLSPSDPRPPTVRFDSIVVLAGGRRRCIGLGGVGFAPSNEDLAFRAGVCHLMNLFLRTMFNLRHGPVQFLGLFFGH